MLEDLKEFIAYRFDELHEDINGLCEEIKTVDKRVMKLENKKWIDRGAAGLGGVIGGILTIIGLKGFKF